MYYKREITNKIQNLLAQFPAVILTGARQVGKTTLLRHLFPEYRYVSLDLPTIAEMAENEPQAFFENYPPPVIIDEAQYAPQLFRQVKVLIDGDKKKKGRFLITGSQNFLLMKQVTESLAGRVGFAELDTFSSLEILNSNPQAFDCKKRSDILRLLVRGTFPELWEDENLNANEFYRSYLSTYLERDVRTLSNIGSLRDFERFLRICATRSGQLVNQSELGKEVGISLPTANQWLSILQASHQISFLEPYFENIGKRLVKTPKLYFHDTGLLCFLLGLTQDSFSPASPLIGPIWETFVFNQIKRGIAHQSTSATVWLWRDRYKNEVDFVVNHQGKFKLVEAKFGEQPTPSDIAKIKFVQEQIGARTSSAVIASPVAMGFKTKEGIRVINAATETDWIH